MPHTSLSADYLKKVNPKPHKYIHPSWCLAPSRALLKAIRSFANTFSIANLDHALDNHFPPLIDVYNGLPDNPPPGLFRQDTPEVYMDRVVKEILAEIMVLHSGIVMRNRYREQYPSPKLEAMKQLFSWLAYLVAVLEGTIGIKPQRGEWEGVFELLEGGGAMQPRTGRLEGLFEGLREEARVR